MKDRFVIDQTAALQYCNSAREALSVGDSAGNAAEALQLLIRALIARPSSMLAYQLLSEVLEKTQRPDDAVLCRRGVLPEDVACQLPGAESVPRHSGKPGANLNDVKRHVLYAGQSIDLPVPMGIAATGAPARPALFHETTIASKECFIDQIDAGQLWHDAQHTLVLDSHGCEVSEHSMCDRKLILAMMSNHSPLHIDGRVFLIGARGAHNFYHWMADITPKLAVLKKAGFVFTANDHFVVPFANAEFCRQMVRQFGVEPTQLIETEKQSPWLCADQLVVPLVDNKMGLTMGGWLPELMKQQFVPLAGDLNTRADASSGRRLFITRDSQSSDGRQIENQQAVVALLQQRGFECIQPEQYSVSQQAQLFADASVVVAAHGAALSNIMFCKAGTTVVEFYGAHLAPCYWAISALCDLSYYHHYCGNNLNASHGSAQGRSGNLTVPLPELDELLALAGVV